MEIEKRWYQNLFLNLKINIQNKISALKLNIQYWDKIFFNFLFIYKLKIKRFFPYPIMINCSEVIS